MFLVKGVSIGQTTVSAVVVDKTGRKVTSAPQQIEVPFYVNYLNVGSCYDSYKYYAIFIFYFILFYCFARYFHHSNSFQGK